MRTEEYRDLDATSVTHLIKRADVSPTEATEAAPSPPRLPIDKSIAATGAVVSTISVPTAEGRET